MTRRARVPLRDHPSNMCREVRFVEDGPKGPLSGSIYSSAAGFVVVCPKPFRDGVADVLVQRALEGHFPTIQEAREALRMEQL